MHEPAHEHVMRGQLGRQWVSSAPDEDPVVGAEQAEELGEVPRPLGVQHHCAFPIGMARQAHVSVDRQPLGLGHADRTRIAQILRHAGRERIAQVVLDLKNQEARQSCRAQGDHGMAPARGRDAGELVLASGHSKAVGQRPYGRRVGRLGFVGHRRARRNLARIG